MGSAVERTDEHVREYLIYRGFTNTLKHLDSDIKADKEKGFRVRRGNMDVFWSIYYISTVLFSNPRQGCFRGRGSIF